MFSDCFQSPIKSSKIRTYNNPHKLMTKKFLSILLLLAIFFPQTALAHFEASHTAFLYEPMHWFMQHYFLSTLIGIGLLGTAIYLKEKSEKE